MTNGVTTQTTSLPWTTGGITIGIILVSGLISAAGALGSATSATAGGSAALETVPASTATPAFALGSGPAPQAHLMSPWADSNVLAPTSPTGVHSSLPLGAASPAHFGGGEAFALAAAGTILAAGSATTATTTAANGSGSNAAQPHDHVETTAPSSPHGPFGHMDPIVLFLHFQSISSSGLLSLKYPPIYQAFTVGVLVIARVKLSIYSLSGQLRLGKLHSASWGSQKGSIPF